VNSPIQEDAQAFFDVANRFIGLANQLAGDHGQPRVAAAILWAASRYGAFTWAMSGAPEKQPAAEALDLFEAQYRKMMEDNLERILAELGGPKD
jgi:hypothetical protein